MINLSNNEKMMELIEKLRRISRKQDAIEARLKKVEKSLNSEKNTEK
jgi:hypothetical protein